jgi:hypothetical protein
MLGREGPAAKCQPGIPKLPQSPVTVKNAAERR